MKRAIAACVVLIGLNSACEANEPKIPNLDLVQNCKQFTDKVDAIYANQAVARDKCIAQEYASFSYLSSAWALVSEDIKRDCLLRPPQSRSYRFSVLAVCIRGLVQEQKLGRRDRAQAFNHSPPLGSASR